MSHASLNELAHMASEARNSSYAPYSGFTVGAALLCEDGTVITGSNVENRCFPAGLCAERTAIFAAVSHGHRNFRAIAISGGPKGCEPEEYCMPCGMCLQVMSEFCDPDFTIHVVKSEEDILSVRLKDLYPCAFHLPEIPPEDFSGHDNTLGK